MPAAETACVVDVDVTPFVVDVIVTSDVALTWMQLFPDIMINGSRGLYWPCARRWRPCFIGLT